MADEDELELELDDIPAVRPQLTPVSSARVSVASGWNAPRGPRPATTPLAAGSSGSVPQPSPQTLQPPPGAPPPFAAPRSSINAALGPAARPVGPVALTPTSTHHVPSQFTPTTTPRPPLPPQAVSFSTTNPTPLPRASLTPGPSLPAALAPAVPTHVPPRTPLTPLFPPMLPSSAPAVVPTAVPGPPVTAAAASGRPTAPSLRAAAPQVPGPPPAPFAPHPSSGLRAGAQSAAALTVLSQPAVSRPIPALPAASIPTASSAPTPTPMLAPVPAPAPAPAPALTPTTPSSALESLLRARAPSQPDRAPAANAAAALAPAGPPLSQPRADAPSQSRPAPVPAGSAPPPVDVPSPSRRALAPGESPHKRRRLPGPAGFMTLRDEQLAALAAASDATVDDAVATQQKVRWHTMAHMPAGMQECLFFKGPWMTMSRTLDVPLPTPVNNAELEKIVADVSLLSAPQARFVSNKDAILASPQMAMCLARVTRARSIPRIKQLIVSVKDMTVNDTDISATLQDLSGEIIGCVHRRVLEEFGKEFGVGAVLVLKKVSVFSPSIGSHYLNIVPECIAKIFPAFTG